jgi:hypothetical protein
MFSRNVDIPDMNLLVEHVHNLEPFLPSVSTQESHIFATLARDWWIAGERSRLIGCLSPNLGPDARLPIRAADCTSETKYM